MMVRGAPGTFFFYLRIASLASRSWWVKKCAGQMQPGSQLWIHRREPEASWVGSEATCSLSVLLLVSHDHMGDTPKQGMTQVQDKAG